MAGFNHIIKITSVAGGAVFLALGFSLNTLAESLPPQEGNPAISPVPSETTPAVEPEKPIYIYNSETRRWDSNKWRYDANQGKYVRNTPPPPPVAPTTLTTDSSNASALQATGQPEANGDVNQSVDASADVDVSQNTTVNNNLDSVANSGNAVVSSNTMAGNATSGNASATANYINMLQSQASLQGGTMSVFTSDIYGNVQGDMMIDPSYLHNLNNQQLTDIDINYQANGEINNYINLAAATGDASVIHNTSAGDANSGNALAMANIVNIINSIIGSGQSFMGTINIHGNFDGDILLPPNALNSLLASNSSTSNTTDSSFSAELTNVDTINNTVTLNAASGAANVTNNTTAGNATTGNASTMLTVLNMTGQQVIGKNCLLVFVNVMGSWIGMIVNAPDGATAAALAGGVTQNNLLTRDTEINSQNSSNINNVVSANATSGDTEVSGNTRAGNATSGNAQAVVNLMNISSSSLSLSDWLGILFINVFGNWNGSFGIDTEAGGMADSTANNGGSDGQVKVFSFVSASQNSYKLKPIVAQTAAFGDNEQNSEAANTNSNSVVAQDEQKPVTLADAQARPGPGFSLLYPVLGLLVAIAILGADKLLTYRKTR